MMQGDAYGVSIEIRKEDGTIVTESDVSDVEITIGNMTKTKSGGAVRFEDNVWVFPVTQAETFKLPAARTKVQVRVVWPNGDVEGVVLDDILVRDSLSREVL